MVLHIAVPKWADMTTCTGRTRCDWSDPCASWL